MGWQSDTIMVVRQLVGDVDEDNLLFSDDRLTKAIVSSAILVLLDNTFINDYTVSLSDLSISPDPSSTSNKDNNFISLVALNAACLLLAGEVRKSSGNSISVRDGPSSIDLSGVSESLSGLYKSLCEKFEDAKFQHRAGRVVGHAIFNTYSPGSAYVNTVYNREGRMY